MSSTWAQTYRFDTMDRDAFCWQTEDPPTDDATNDFFNQFVDFDTSTSMFPSSTMSGPADDMTADVPRLADTLLMDHPPESIGSSTTPDDFDFLSSSSHVGPGSSAGQDIDPSALSTNAEHHPFANHHHHFDYPGRASISDTDLPRLEGMMLTSPTRAKHVSASQPSSPTPPNTMVRKPTNTFFENAKSTLKKVTRRKPKKEPEAERPGSPVDDLVPAPLNISRQRPRKAAGSSKKPSNSPPTHNPHPANFIQGACHDPFNDVPPVPQHLRCYTQGGNGVSPPMISPGVKSEPGSYHSADYTSQMAPQAAWNQQINSMPQQSVQWNGMSAVTPDESGAWDFTQGQFVNQKHVEVNQTVYNHHSELPYEYQNHSSEMATSGLMIQMPQSHQQQPTMVNELTHNAQTHLPPPPPPQPASEKQHRPPKAPSSGARHLSQSPVRRNRAPSASPTRTTQTPSKRHSSGGSVSSARSASGRLPASMPGTPCSVRKRKSRDPSNGGMGGGGGGGGEIGFVNFTPGDGSMLMTGVAPSGSSKTKARREKEAVDRRRKLSEAALKAVAAAGGDVEALMQQGFTF